MSSDLDLLIRVRADINKALGDLKDVQRGIRSVGDTADGATGGVNRLDNATTQAAQGAIRTAGAFQDLRNVLVLGYATYQIESFTRSIVEANVQAQRIHYTLQSVTGSASGAAEEFAFISGLSKKLGLDLQTTANAYARLAVSAKSAGVTQAEMHQAFIGLADTFTVLHTPAEDVMGLLVQLEQGMSLGKLQMQDFRAIAQHLPGTFELVSEAVHRMGGNLADMLQHGGVPAKQFFMQFTALLRDKYGPESAAAAQGLNAELNRLHTTIFGLETQPSGFVESFTASLHDLNQELNDPAMQEGIKNLISGLGDTVHLLVKGTSLVGKFGAGLGILVAQAQGIKSANDPLAAANQQLDAINHKLQILQSGAYKSLFGGAEASDILKSVNIQGDLTTRNVQAAIHRLLIQKNSLDIAVRELKKNGGSYDFVKPVAKPDTTQVVAQTDYIGQFIGNALLDGMVKGFQDPKSLTAIQTIIASLKQQSATYGETSQQIAIYRLRTLGATDAQVKEAQALAANIEKQDAAKKALTAKADADRKAAAAAKQHADQLHQDAERIKDMLDPMRQYQRELVLLREEYQAGELTSKQYQDAIAKIGQEMKRTADQANKSSNQMNQFAIQAARNIQDVLANALETGFKGGLKSMVDAFGQAMQKMAAQAAAADLAKRMFGNYGSTGQIGGWAGMIGQFAAQFFHDGGDVGAGGRAASVPAFVFAGAPRMHTGGWPGLAADEVPAILQKGERVLSRRELARGIGAGNPTVIQNIQTPDLRSFQRASGQLYSDAAAQMQRASQRYS